MNWSFAALDLFVRHSPLDKSRMTHQSCKSIGNEESSKFRQEIHNGVSLMKTDNRFPSDERTAGIPVSLWWTYVEGLPMPAITLPVHGPHWRVYLLSGPVYVLNW